MTDISQKIVQAANSTGSVGSGWCLAWVDNVYANAGVGGPRYGTAYEASQNNIISTDKSAIPIGAAVYGTGAASGGAGHVGIYMGGGKVKDQKASVDEQNLEDWIAWQTDTLGGKQGWLGWGWQDGNRVRGTDKDPNATKNSPKNDKDDDDDDDNKNGKKDKDEKNDDTKQKGVSTPVNGDGYHEEYTSSAGITYKQFKQFTGTYHTQNYWGGNIASHGCGPTSISILASGLTNLNYTPGDIAAQMDANYGYTWYESLQKEMDSLGMKSEVIHNPTSKQIKDYLKAGKVMLMSVNASTGFTTGSHIMTALDINEEGKVYIGNPGSDISQGWYSVGFADRGGCQYIVVTDASEGGTVAPGGSSSTEAASYTAVVANWKQVQTEVITDDPNAQKRTQTAYMMTTTNVNYEEMVAPYTMPFDLLWALLVVGEDKNFVFELAQLVYDSDIEITVYNNTAMDVQIDEWQYTKRTKAVVNGSISAIAEGQIATKQLTDDVHEPYAEEDFKTTKIVRTQTNTVNVELTRANVWIVDYERNYTQDDSNKSPEEKTKKKVNDTYKDKPDRVSNSFSCDHIENKKEKAKEELKPFISKNATITFQNDIQVEFYDKYVNISDNITKNHDSQRYTQGQPNLKEKTDKDAKEPNFVNIFLKNEYRKNKSRTLDAVEWLFEIIENNDSTKDMLDLIKYLLYKATGHVYDGIDSFDFDIFLPGSGLKPVGSGSIVGSGSLEEKVWFTLKSFGFSDFAVAGAMGNMYYESDGFVPERVEYGFDEYSGGIGLCRLDQ